MIGEELRRIPSVDDLLQEPLADALIASYGREVVVDALRQSQDLARDRVKQGAPAPSPAMLTEWAESALRTQLPETLRRVINATGVVVHTNLGRAPLSTAAREAVDLASRGYSSLEYDLGEGRRGHRNIHCESVLCELTGADAALVVNNNAGAVLLTLTGLACGRGVAISRGQLIEIGGGFRIPDVMTQSGARLVEVGTTNRTHLRDYAEALTANPDIAVILRAHHSNYRIIGFATEPDVRDLVSVAGGLAVVDDLGSGAMLDTDEFGLRHEPTVQESIAAGASVVCFSGDKLLGGPQAGIVVGLATYVDRLRSHPLARALRPDKMCLAGLRATLLHYMRGEATSQIPVWRAISTSLDELRERAARWREALDAAGIPTRLMEGRSAVGGGSLPGETLPTVLLAVEVDGPDDLASRLRAATPAVVARIVDDRLVLDPRSVLPEEDADLVQVLGESLGVAGGKREEGDEAGP